MILGKNIKKKSLKNGPETIIHVNSKKKKRERQKGISLVIIEKSTQALKRY